MAVVWCLTLLVPAPGFAVGLVRAMSEAGIVGGLADWFAVTALFRHPLGLPIPHTAIVPANQKRIAATLGSFIASNFLTRELMVRKARELGLGRRTAQWLASPDMAPVLSTWAAGSLRPLVQALESAELRDVAGRALGDRLRRADLAPALAAVLRTVAGTPEANVLLGRLFEAASDWIEANRAEMFVVIDQGSRWWVPKTVNRRVAEAVADGLLEVLADLRRPDSEQRGKLIASLVELGEGYVRSPERRAELDGFLARVLDDEGFNAWLRSIWRGLTETALRDADDPASPTRQALERMLATAGKALAADPAFIGRIDALAERMSLLVVARRHTIAGVVDEVVRSWDPHTMSERLELAVGRDLQYIRMNGTLVGALVGGVLFGLATLLRQ